MRYVSYNQHINRVTRRFTFMRRAQNADTHALKQHRLTQNISPVCSSFALVVAADMHLESESEQRAKNVDFHTAKNIQIQATTFSLFLDEFLETDFRPIYCSPTSTPPFTVPCNIVLARPAEREPFSTTSVCLSLRWSGGLRPIAYEILARTSSLVIWSLYEMRSILR